MFLSSVIQTIRRQNLLVPGMHVLVGVSGGADSVALLSVLRELAPRWKLRLSVAHLNHGIRGRAANEDAAFVAQLARGWKLPLIAGRANVPALARRRGISLEMAGRSARYAFFAKVARLHRCDAVATAHTADDQVETVLLNFSRGAGAAGLAGIPYIGRHGALRVIRPLRDMDRKSIEIYLRRRRLVWREDATNADPMFLRNRVRHDVLPYLEAGLNPGIRQAILRAGEILGRENDWLNALTDELFAQCALPGSDGMLDAKRLAALPVAARRRILRRWLETRNPEAASFDTIERLDDLVTDHRGGRTATLSGGVRVRREGAKLVSIPDGHWKLHSAGSVDPAYKNSCCRPGALTGRCGKDRRRQSQAEDKTRAVLTNRHYTGVAAVRRTATLRHQPSDSNLEFARAFSVCLVVPGQTRLPKQGLRVTASIAPGIVKERYDAIGALPSRASLSLKAWRKRRLVARYWKAGDRMRPLGLNGAKKLQDIFSDAKAPSAVRHGTPIIACGDEIVWIPGYRIAQGWEVGANERKALQLVLARM